MNRRALILALTLAMAAATVLMIYMRRFETEMSGGERIELLTLVKPLERGTTVTDDVLSSRSVPIAYVEDRAIKAVEKAKVLGLKTNVPLQAQQTLMWTDLAITTEERDLSSLVQPGKRAVTVRASGTEDTRGNALIRPGDYVDVLVTMVDQSDPNQTEAQREKAAVVLLQKVLVLAVGLDTHSAAVPDPKAAPNPNQGEKALTLSLNLQEAQLLALAVERGRLSVAVRNPDDQRVVEAVPDIRSNVLLDSTQRETVQHARPGSAAKRDEPIHIGGRNR